MRNNEFYDTRTFWKSILTLIAIMGAMYLTGGSGFIVVIPFALAALFQRNSLKLFFWLLLTIAMVVGNATLMPKDMIFSIAQRLLLIFLSAMMTIQIAGSGTSKIVKSIMPFLVYIIYIMIPSAFGWNPIISFLKIILFLSIFMAFLGAATGIANGKSNIIRKMRGIMLGFMAFYMIGSLFLIPFPGIGQMIPSEFIGQSYNPDAVSLFKGMTMHSQCLGPCAAGVGVFLLADFIFSIRKFDRLYALLMGTVPILLYKTSSRTAMGAYLAGCAVVCFIFINAAGVATRWKGKVMNVVALIITLCSIAVVVIPSLNSSVVKFATKGRTSSNANIEDFVGTRMGKYEESMEGFRQRPLLGNGFQVNALMAGMKGSSIKDYLSAPVEKGFWWAAVLEEGGIVGMIIFLLVLLNIFIGSMRNRAYIGISCFITLFICNFGEFMMFSMSYTGGFMWAVVFCGYTLDALRVREISSSYIGGYYANYPNL